jgi:hypothetical protein
MVARHEDDLASGPEPVSERPQHRLGDLHRVLVMPFGQLDDVTQQDQPVDCLERVKQSRQYVRPCEDGVRKTIAEMEV